MKQLLIDGIGVSVMLTRKRVKNINIRVTSDGIVRVSAPYTVTDGYIDELISKRGRFILKAVSQAREASRRNAEESERGIRYLGRLCMTDIRAGSRQAVAYDSVTDTFTVTVKASEPQPQEAALAAVKAYIRKSAAEIFSRMNADVHTLFIAHGYNVPLADIHIKDMESRWGSLNPTKASLSINLRLMKYPVECAEAVFCHEYAHFLHADHSARFYSVLAQVCPDYKAVHRLLKD